MPAYNEGRWVERALAALSEAAGRADWPLDVVVVDDGSTDAESLAVLAEVAERSDVRVLRQSNAGRFAARSAGLDVVTTEVVLLLDARVEVHPESLARIRAAVGRGDEVWNYDVVPGSRDLRALFWTGITKVWWRDYFRRRKAVAFGLDDFDRYPKGTGAFLAPTALLRRAADGFDSHFGDSSLASDDTRLLRAVAGEQDIHLSPDVLCTHHAKTGRGSWSRQCFYRGTTFVDGYLADPSAARGLLVGVVGAITVGGLAAAARPRTTAGAGVLACVAAGALAGSCGATGRESVAVGALSPAFGVCFGAGVLRGLRMAASAA
ncbi:glycosyltransferase family 2 protein [Nocardioides cavernae]|uniref:Glycosyltransferase family 2 protein n=1 Tax=Nocardioides cavernae TaxID=1921566 RepID=A0ABR8NEU7_9ACTN|nr:glycosyltransferase family 2 protein [Nocardioides cavernae]MBM7512385.1 glycosyltransferase involved in cell wall biosynthesis [Nocardioides cavernae]